MNVEVFSRPGDMLALVAVRHSDGFAWNWKGSAWEAWPKMAVQPVAGHMLPLVRFATLGPLAALYTATIPAAVAGEPALSLKVLRLNQDSQTYSLVG